MALINRHKETFGLDRLLVMVDPAYNGSKTDTFHIPARKAGAELVIDYKYDDRGIQGHYRDLKLVDGSWYVASMPEDLVEATWDLHLLEGDRPSLSAEEFDEKRSTLLARIRNRELYRMMPKGLPDHEGYQRFTYPKRDAPAPHEPLDGATSITIPILVPETEAPARKPGGKKRTLQPIKHLQKFPYMGDDWYAHYGMRNLVESSNSRFKDPAHEALGNPRKRSGRGFAFQYLATALSIVSFNLRAIASFLLKLRNRSVEKPVRTRRRKGPDGWPLTRPVKVTAPAPAPPG